MAMEKPRRFEIHLPAERRTRTIRSTDQRLTVREQSHDRGRRECGA